MAIGRISGSVLKSNLTRNGVDLAFETNLLYLDVTNNRVGIGTSEPSTALHIVGNTTITGDLSVSGNIVFEAASINSLDTGAISIDDNTIAGYRSNEDIIVSAAGTGRIILKNTLVANTIESDDSTAIQINDGVNVSGTLNAKTLITNTISSEDSSAIQINDAVNASGTITAAGFVTHGTSGNITGVNNIELNQISSNDSTAVQVADDMNVSGILTAPTFVTNNISSADSSAIQINDAVNVSGTLTATGLVANGITYPSSDGSANQVLTTNGSGVLSFTSLSAFTGITFVGDDSTGSTINTAETFKIVGGSNITTTVSGDTLTINGSNPAQGITFIGDDSTGTQVSDGESFKIAGGTGITTAVSGDTLTITGSSAQGITFVGDDSSGTAVADGGTLQIVGAGSVTTAMSGNILTITGTSSIDSLNTGGLLIDDNKITGSRSNEDIEISTSGTGVITTNASIIPTTDDAVDLGSLTKRFRKGYFGSGTVYIGDQTISSSKTGLIFSGRINTPSSMLDETAKIISKIGIDTSEKTIDRFSTSDIRSALYYQVYRDEIRDEVIASKTSIVHDGLEAFMSVSAVGNSTSVLPHVGHNTLSATVVGDDVLYKVTGDSAINSIQCYRLPLFDNTGLKNNGRTSTLRYENLSTAETVIDTWSIGEYRSAKYFVSVSDEGAQISNDYLNAEISMVHNGTDAYITTYNIVSSSNDSFIIFTADVSDGVARLKARSTGGTLNLKLHKLLLSDTESTDETDYQKIVGTTTTSSAAATIDSFHLTDTTAAFYTLSAHDTNNSQSSVSEVVVVHNGHDVSIIVGPQLSTDGTIHIEWSAYIRGNQLFLQASGSESEIKITGYRISLYRPEAGNSNASLSAQGITFVGDDSTGTRISDNETVKITGGAGITTSMIGDVLTITATGEATAQGLTFVGDDSSGTRISDGETVKITGSGGVTTAMSGDTLTINGPTAFTFSVAGDDSTQRAISTGNTIKFVGSNGISTATDAAGNVTISGTTLVTLNIDGGATATVYDLTGLNLDGGSGSSTYGAGETSVNGGGA